MIIHIENHPFAPVFAQNTQVLMMGTMPPTPDKWCMPFHYPNFQNDMWRIYGKIFFDNTDHFRVGEEKRFDAEKIRQFLLDNRIGECPTVTQIIRKQGNASDDNLQIISKVNLVNVLQLAPNVQWLFTTGGKATEILVELINQTNPKQKLGKTPKIGEICPIMVENRSLKLYRLPSSSRAYPLSFDKKVEHYRKFFEIAEII